MTTTLNQPLNILVLPVDDFTGIIYLLNRATEHLEGQPAGGKRTDDYWIVATNTGFQSNLDDLDAHNYNVIMQDAQARGFTHIQFTNKKQEGKDEGF